MKFLEVKRLKQEPENKMLSGPAENKMAGGGGAEDPFASEQAKTLALDSGLENQVHLIPGTGRGGKITSADVRRFADEQSRDAASGENEDLDE